MPNSDMAAGQCRAAGYAPAVQPVTQPPASGLPPAPAPRGFAPFPAPEAVKPWTPADECELKELRGRLEALDARRNRAGIVLRMAVAAAMPGPNWEIDQIAEALAHHADAIRDALAPFDSGVREANG